MQDKAFEIVEVFKTDKDNAEDKNEIIEHKEMLPADSHDVMHLLHQIESIKSACNAAIKDIKDELLERYSGKVVRDSDKVLDYLGSDYRQAVRPSFRKGGVEAVAQKRGDNPKVIWDSLFYEELTETLTILDVNNPKTPKYMKEMDDLQEKDVR